MKQPRIVQDVDIFNDATGEYTTVSRSVALEGQPTGAAQFGPISICPVTGEVLYESEMVQYRGRYYSTEGLEEVLDSDRI